jgi:Fe-S cluster biosynthesis and repair protein YggX
MSDVIKCARCGQKRAPLGFSPLPTELGQKIATEVCQPCWAEWLQAQTRIINHYGLDLMNPDAQGFLMDNMKGSFTGRVAGTDRHQQERSNGDLRRSYS